MILIWIDLAKTADISVNGSPNPRAYWAVCWWRRCVLFSGYEKDCQRLVSKFQRGWVHQSYWLCSWYSPWKTSSIPLPSKLISVKPPKFKHVSSPCFPPFYSTRKCFPIIVLSLQWTSTMEKKWREISDNILHLFSHVAEKHIKTNIPNACKTLPTLDWPCYQHCYQTHKKSC